MWIRWIRIRNTGFYHPKHILSHTKEINYADNCGGKAVLWIRDILARIRRSGSGSVDPYHRHFSSVAYKMPTKNKFFLEVFCLLLFESTITSVFNFDR
jgi:hypothetical protein